jgi:hypothetical protein
MSQVRRHPPNAEKAERLRSGKGVAAIQVVLRSLPGGLRHRHRRRFVDQPAHRQWNPAPVNINDEPSRQVCVAEMLSVR